jgi:hypothetical protein
MAQTLRAELATQAALHEYDALRSEIMSLQQRTHQLLGVSIAGAGAVLSAGVVGKLDQPSLELLLFGAAALLGLVAVSFFGHANKQMEIGLYLRRQAIELRRGLQELDPGYVDANRLMAWEDRSTGSLSVTGGIVSRRLMFADAMQLFELVALGVLPLVLMVGGFVVYIGDTGRTEIATALAVADGIIFFIVMATIVLSLTAGASRDREARRDAMVALGAGEGRRSQGGRR